MTAAIEVRKRPIPFTAEMVRAILDGRKSQTRRVMKVQPGPSEQIRQWLDGSWQIRPVEYSARLGEWVPLKCPYRVGDHLWVKETYGSATCLTDDPYVYKADSEDGECPACGGKHRWKSGRFMHKLAARIWLEVTDVRVERLQAISEEDAKAEGVLHNWIGQDCPPEYQNEYMNYEGDEEDFPCYSARDSYRTLWDKINAKRPGCDWDSNPFVWCYTFRRIER
jgi:hypothetical protein